MNPYTAKPQNILEIKHLSANQWEIYRNIRLRGLKEDPQAFARSYEEEKNYPQEKWLERVRNDYNLVAFETRQPVGTMSAYTTEEDGQQVAHIVGVYVAKEARGRGIGTLLLNKVLEKIKENKRVVKVDLTVNKEQLAAVKLYKKFGFQITGEKVQKMGDGQEHIEYQMELNRLQISNELPRSRPQNSELTRYLKMLELR